MALLLTSIRIKADDGYPVRAASTIKVVRAESKTLWEDGTSLFLLTSGKSAAAFARHIQENSYFDPEEDKLLVINLGFLQDHVSLGFDHEKMLEFVLSVAR